MAIVIVVLVVKCLSLSDELERKENLSDLYFKMYSEIKDKYDEDEKIIDNIKNSLPF